MNNTPHKNKLIAAIDNPKCSEEDKEILSESLKQYETWISKIDKIKEIGKNRVFELTNLLNEYKYIFEVELISKSQSSFLLRQKGQLKLDSSIMEEFLTHLVDKRIFSDIPDFQIETGPQTVFMSVAFTPQSLKVLEGRPDVEIKSKDMDFALGKSIHYKFSPDSGFIPSKTEEGKIILSLLCAECKVNLDKTMFQEAAGTAFRLKQGCPVSRYYLLVEYLDMEPEDCRLTSIDNVYLLRHAKRLPFEKRNKYEEVKAQHLSNPIDAAIVWQFCCEVQKFISAVWYDPNEALNRGSFI